jgi:hypothetical protein
MMATMSETLQQQPDGTWRPAESLRAPLLVRLEIRIRRWLKGSA